MIGSNKQTIEDIIVEILARKPYILGPQLVDFVQKRDQKQLNKPFMLRFLLF